MAISCRVVTCYRFFRLWKRCDRGADPADGKDSKYCPIGNPGLVTTKIVRRLTLGKRFVEDPGGVSPYVAHSAEFQSMEPIAAKLARISHAVQSTRGPFPLPTRMNARMTGSGSTRPFLGTGLDLCRTSTSAGWTHKMACIHCQAHKTHPGQWVVRRRAMNRTQCIALVSQFPAKPTSNGLRVVPPS